MQVLTDAQWAKFEAAIAAANIRGARPRTEDRRTIEAIIWRLDNGAKWRFDPAPFVPSFISRVRSPYAPAWGGLQKLLG
jgi:transposase